MLAVLHNTIRDSHHRDSGEYSNWRTEQRFSVVGVEHVDSQDALPMNSRPDYDTFNVPGDIGDVAYVISMTYRTGDSFGNASGNGEILMVYTDKVIAKDALTRFKDAIKDNKDPYSVSIPVQTHDGCVMFDCVNPAAGYFERAESVDLDAFIIV